VHTFVLIQLFRNRRDSGIFIVVVDALNRRLNRRLRGGFERRSLNGFKPFIKLDPPYQATKG
jgi:hypothetical protein